MPSTWGQQHWEQHGRSGGGSAAAPAESTECWAHKAWAAREAPIPTPTIVAAGSADLPFPCPRLQHPPPPPRRALLCLQASMSASLPSASHA